MIDYISTIGPAITDIGITIHRKIELKLHSGVGKDTELKHNETDIIKVLLLFDYTALGPVTVSLSL